MANLIIAVNKRNGIGLNNSLPWKCKEDLKLFKTLTLNKTLIIGRKTLENLPYLENRKIICLTKQNPKQFEINNYNYNDVSFVNTIDTNMLNENVFVAGGNEIYEHFLTKHKRHINRIYLSEIDDDTECDTYFDKSLLFENYIITKETTFDTFKQFVIEPGTTGEEQYLGLIRKILNGGETRETRSGKTLSIFHNNLTFDLRKGFPLLTTKKMFLRGIIEEFIFFINGETNSNLLSEKKVRIWEGNTTEEFIKNKGLPYSKGIMGPMYGYQWRFFNAPYDIDVKGIPFKPKGGIDQFQNVLNLIRNDPKSRRILMTAYNPAQAEQGVLYPCHSIVIQFYVQNEYLDMFCYNRSQDVGLGVPFNIASSSLLLMLVSKLTNKIPRFFHMTMGDTHIYDNHIQPLQEQINRIPYSLPKLTLSDNLDINNLNVSDFVLSEYKSHGKVKMDMSS